MFQKCIIKIKLFFYALELLIKDFIDVLITCTKQKRTYSISEFDFCCFLYKAKESALIVLSLFIARNASF
ncbi:hypothetical protein FM106_07660 [Brachybacterium faecium]|nr:hypothetical protein FM106_07660 [Brachybacterium faecium]